MAYKKILHMLLPQKAILGVLLFILSGAVLALEDAFIKFLPENVPLLQIVFFNNLFALIPILFIYFFKNEKIAVSRENFFLHTIRSIFSLITVFCFIGALRLISLSQTLTLSFTAPFFMVILGSLIMKRKMTFSLLLSISLGFFAVVILFNPDFERFYLGETLALLSGLSYALSLIILEKLHLKENDFSIYINFIIFSTVAVGAFVPFYWEPLDMSLLLILSFIGILYGSGIYLLIQSLKLASINQLAPFDYVALIWVILLDYFMFEVPVSNQMFLGMSIIIFTNLYVLKKSTADYKSLNFPDSPIP